jgi:CDP-paratose 2-epimerase
VYNLGGGRSNAASLMECVTTIEGLLGRPLRTRYVDRARKGDHICYISDLGKLQAHYPHWRLTRSLDQILEELVRG